MKTLIFFVTALFLAFCARQSDINELKAQLDSLKQSSYKPGLGDFMSRIQVHHAKLYFAGTNSNWQLADFEIHELRETVEGIVKYRSDRKESQMVIMLYPVLDSVSMSVKQQNPELFKTTYTALTGTCNNCHDAVNYKFNYVKIPDAPPFSNQVFEPQNK